MAVITCRSCSAKVHEGATGCPECGADPRTGESIMDWSRLRAPYPTLATAEAQRVRENALPIGLCIAGAVWACVVWAAMSFLVALAGAEGADSGPLRHTGLFALMFVYFAVAGCAIWASLRLPSDLRHGGTLALVAFLLGYGPAVVTVLMWGLMEDDPSGGGALAGFVAALWTLGGWPLPLAATVAWRRAACDPVEQTGPGESETAIVIAAVGACTGLVLALITFMQGWIHAAGSDETNPVAALALGWAACGVAGAVAVTLLRRRRGTAGMALLGVAAVMGFFAVATAPQDIPYDGGRPELLATWGIAALPFCLAIAVGLSERRRPVRPVDWRYGATVVLACVGAFVAVWVRPQVVGEAAEASSPFWYVTPATDLEVTFGTVLGGLVAAAGLAFAAAAICYWRPLWGAVAAVAAAVAALAGILFQAYPSTDSWRVDTNPPSWAWNFVQLWMLGIVPLGLAALFSYRRWREPMPPVAVGAGPAPGAAAGREVAAPAAAGTLAHMSTTTSRGDPVHDDHEHDHQTSGSALEPGVDARSGQLEPHCSQCGSLIEGSHEFCQVCALEASGGELPPETEAD